MFSVNTKERVIATGTLGYRVEKYQLGRYDPGPRTNLGQARRPLLFIRGEGHALFRHRRWSATSHSSTQPKSSHIWMPVSYIALTPLCTLISERPSRWWELSQRLRLPYARSLLQLASSRL